LAEEETFLSARRSVYYNGCVVSFFMSSLHIAHQIITFSLIVRFRRGVRGVARHPRDNCVYLFMPVYYSATGRRTFFHRGVVVEQKQVSATGMYTGMFVCPGLYQGQHG